ncbi:MAG: hypothetical protein WAM77_16285 [Xanthobacteraceae bacterium]
MSHKGSPSERKAAPALLMLAGRASRHRQPHHATASATPAHMQTAGFEFNLMPLQIANLGRSQTMTIGEQDHGRVPVTVTIQLASYGNQLLDFGCGQVFAGPRN